MLEENNEIECEELIWEIKPHTSAKHEILRRYLQAWFNILNAFPNGEIIYIDGFSGPGIHTGGEPGSPIIALDCLLKHSNWERGLFEKRKFEFHFIENNKGRKDILINEIKRLYPQLPPNVAIFIYNNKFSIEIKKIFDAINRKKTRPAAIFSFIDPFGWGDLNLNDVKTLMDYDRSEVLINFMDGFMNRFYRCEDRESSFCSLFGCENWRKFIPENCEDASGLLLQLYKNRLEMEIPNLLMRSFSMDGEGRHLYDLVFSTKHWKGIKTMKSAMWKVDKTGRYCFSDTTNPNQTQLIEFMDVNPLLISQSEEIYRVFSKQRKNVLDIEIYIVVKSNYQFSKDSLKILEKDGKISKVDGRKKKMCYPEGCIIEFN